MSLTSGFPIVTHAPYETPCDSFLLRLLFILIDLVPCESLRHHLRDVLHEELGVSHGLRGIFKHRDAEGASNRKKIGSRFFRLLHPHHPDLLSFRNLVPDVRASTTAAEAVHSASLHLEELETGGRTEDISRRVEDTVHPAEVAGIVVCNPLVKFSDLQPPAPYQLADELGVMNHLKFSPKLRILVQECVEAVGTMDDDLLHPRPPDAFDVLQRELLESSLLPHSPYRLSRA